MLNSEPEGEHSELEEKIDPLNDIIDYLVRCAKISFKNERLDEQEVTCKEKIRLAHDLFANEPIDFLNMFGKYLSPNHLSYFENLEMFNNNIHYQQSVKELKLYHSDESTRKRKRNRRYKAMQKLQNETDYFSEKEMMYRNPLLYEQLIGQYLTDEEIRERDGADNDNLTFLKMILETVDRNEMREKKNEQLLEESEQETHTQEKSKQLESKKIKQWGEFDVPDTRPTFTPEARMQAMISAPERNLLRQEFLQEMYSSFIDGNDPEVDYHAIDNDDQYDDLKQITQDAEDKYFDSETNDEESLEVHMSVADDQRRNKTENTQDDPLDVFMERIRNKVT